MEQVFSAAFGFFVVSTIVLLIAVMVLHRWLAQAQNELQLKRDEVEGIAEHYRQLNGSLPDKLREAEQKAESYRKVIEVAHNERDRWRGEYWASARAAGNAQEHMMIERERNFAIMAEHKIKPFRDTLIDVLAGAYKEDHYEPVKRAMREHSEGQDAQPAKP